jgi:hypothetical protein
VLDDCGQARPLLLLLELLLVLLLELLFVLFELLLFVLLVVLFRLLFESLPPQPSAPTSRQGARSESVLFGMRILEAAM